MDWDKLIGDMKSLDTGDPEGDHYDADELLADALLMLAGSVNAETEEKAAEFISAYDAIRKWYA